MRYLVIDTRSAIPVYVQIVQQIRERVAEGSLTPGAPLPSVRQMAMDLGINPNTVAKAYMLLERDAIILTIPRRGAFVAQAARERARQSVDQRLDEAVDRILGEFSSQGLQRGQLLHALRRRLRQTDPSPRRSGGRPR